MADEDVERLVAGGIIPVIVLENADAADDLAQALIAGGLRAAEVTFRTAAAAEAIARMSRYDELLVGAGTVLSSEQVDIAVDAGARFIVSPGLSAGVVGRARERSVPALPGVVTPSEIMAALDMGLSLMKFFPAEAYGGVATLKAFRSPFGSVSFVPTGGVTEQNVGDYLRLTNVASVGGTWMVQPRLIASGEFDEIAEHSRSAVAQAAAIREEA